MRYALYELTNPQSYCGEQNATATDFLSLISGPFLHPPTIHPDHESCKFRPSSYLRRVPKHNVLCLTLSINSISLYPKLWCTIIYSGTSMRAAMASSYYTRCQKSADSPHSITVQRIKVLIVDCASGLRSAYRTTEYNVLHVQL